MKYAIIRKNQYGFKLEVHIDDYLNEFEIDNLKTNEDKWFVYDSFDLDIRLWFEETYKPFSEIDIFKPFLEIYPYNKVFVKNRRKKESYSISESIPIWFESDEITITKSHISNFDITQLYCLAKTINENKFRSVIDIDALINAFYLSRFPEFFTEEVFMFLKNTVRSFQMLQLFYQEAKKKFPNEFIDFYDERFSLRN